MGESDRKAYTTRETAELLGKAPRTIRRWVEEGVLKAVKVGDKRRGRLLIPAREIDRLLNGAVVGPGAGSGGGK